MRIWTRLHRLVQRLADAACPHPEGTVCVHRQYLYDEWLRGMRSGYQNGRENVESKWSGSVYGIGPYAGYPPPGRDHATAPDAE